ncbi:DNA replication protein [Evansella caseinilytica]|uniref:DNA replication protein n=1 Tax=Evansella caseinilytica TaxID=1503961 RepID=A0A1H3NJ84_9BACI|nr:DnaD domain-containing protein [Evansella caseinilytica]SDY88505.1 DNA replication protein [Evansella caseinilytica]
MDENIMLELYMESPFTMPSSFIKNYVQLGLSDQQMIVLMHIRQFAQEGNYFPTPTDLQQRMTIDQDQCAKILKELLKKGFLGIEEKQDADGRLSEAFSLQPLYEKVILYINHQSVGKEKFSKQQEEGELFRRFEEEFSRPLSPMEVEMISMWLDQDKHEPKMVEAALREAVVSSKLNFRYIDRILYDWKRNGIKSLQQAREHGERIRHHQQAKRAETTIPDTEKQQKLRHPQYNWLKN